MEDYLSNVVKKRFLLLLTETDETVRNEAKERFSLNKDPDIKKLGEIADAVFKVVNRNGKPSELESAVRASRALPDTTYWCGLVEESAKAVLKFAFSLNEHNAEKPELIRYGLRFAGIAIGPAWPLSKETIDLVRLAKKEDSSLGNVVDTMISISSSSLPKDQQPKRFQGKGAEPAGKEEPRAKRRR